MGPRFLINYLVDLNYSCGNCSLFYRSQTGLPWNRPTKTPPNLNWMMTGPQADYWYPVGPWAADWTGQFYSENTPLGILAWRGQVVESGTQEGPRLMGNIADRTPLGGYVRFAGDGMLMLDSAEAAALADAEAAGLVEVVAIVEPEPDPGPSAS